MPFNVPIPLPITSRTVTVSASQSPVVTAASAYTSGNACGGLLTFSNVFGTAGSGIIQSGALRLKSAQTGEFDLYLLRAIPSVAITDKATPALVALDSPLVLGVLVFTLYYSGLGTHTVYQLDAIGKAMSVGQTSLFGVVITKSTPTFTATTDFVAVDITVLQD